MPLDQRALVVLAACCLPGFAWAGHAPPPVAGPSAPAPSAPGPASDAPDAAELPVDTAAVDPKAGLERQVFGADFVPFVGTSMIHRGGEIRSISVNVLGGYTGAVEGVEGAGLVNIDRVGVWGAQGAGLANINLGPLQGGQGAGLANLAWGGVDGVQGAGWLNISGGEVDGVQGAGVMNLSRGGVDGVQGAGWGNVTLGELDGVQASAGLNVAVGVDGVQGGLVNVSAGPVDGVQFGLVNVAKTSDVSIGLVNVIWDGRHHVDLWTNETGFENIAYKGGSDWFHNIFGVGYRPWSPCKEWSAIIGVGGHFELGERPFIDLDVLAQHVSETGGIRVNPNDLYTGRIIGGLRVTERLAITGGFSQNVWVSQVHDGGPYSPWGDPASVSGGTAVREWGGWQLGIQLGGRPFDNDAPVPPDPVI